MHRISIKFIALFLCALSLLTAIASGYGVYLVAEEGLYGEGVADIQERQLRANLRILTEDLAVRYAARTGSNCPPGLIDDYVGLYYIEELLAPNLWYYTIQDKTGQVVDSSTVTGGGEVQRFDFVICPEYPTVDISADQGGLNLDADILFPEDPTEPTFSQEENREEETPIFRRSETFNWFDGNDTQRYTLDIYQKSTYLVSVYLMEGAYEHQDSLQWQILRLAQQHRYTLMVTLAMGLLVFAICAVYLSTAAARTTGKEEKRAGGLNRLPLDLYLVLGSVGSFFLSLAILRLIRWIENPAVLTPGLSGIFLCGFGASLIFVGFWYAVAAQCKTPGGMWWRNMVLVRLGYILHRLSKRFFAWFEQKLRRLRQLLPVTWQWLGLGVALLGLVIWAFLQKSLLLSILVLAVFLLAVLYTGYAIGLLMEGAKNMSRGNLQYRIGGKWLLGLFRDFADHLSALANVAVVAAKKQSRSERMKAELITNVSHDIKTPLTSIINYVDLLQRASTEAEAREYVEVLDRQSLRLKKLIDDLMEMSKASTGNMTVDAVQLDAVESVNQALGEFSDKLDARGLTVVFAPPQEHASILADGRLTWRVLSNLLSNVVKYAMENTRVYVDVVQLEDTVLISVKNISAQPLNISSEELMERFVRGDTSRNTEGSGLGLNIAKSLMELQKGQLHLLVDGDLFKATLVFPRK